MKDMKLIISRLFKRKNIKLKEQDLNPESYDMKAINDRVYRAMLKTGKTRIDIANLYGMDASVPLALQPPEKVPRPTIGNIVKLSNFMGVSVRWILYGEPENDVDIFVGSAPTGGAIGATALGASAAQGAAIITGARNSMVVVQNGKGDDLSPMEQEVIKILRNIPPREQAVAMSYIFALEQEIQEKQGGDWNTESERIRVSPQDWRKQKTSQPVEGSSSGRLENR